MANKFDKIRNQYNTKGLSRGILTGTKRALNKSVKGLRSSVRKDLRRSLGVTSKIINKRVLLNKTGTGLTNRNSLRASVAVAIKRFMPMRLFKPKEKIVRVQLVNRRKKAIRHGVTIKIGKSKREIVPGAFLMDLPATLVVAKRKGRESHPTRELFTKVFQEEVKDKSKKFTNELIKRFEKIVNREIDFAVQQKLNKK